MKLTTFTRWASVITITLLLALAGKAYWDYQKHYPSTDDAYVQAHVIQIASQISGPVSAIYVKDQSRVKRNTLLFSIDPAYSQHAFDQAKAHLEQVTKQLHSQKEIVKADQAVIKSREATFELAQKNAKRVLQLVEQKLLPAASRDTTIQQLKSAKAGLNAAIEQLKSAQALLGATDKRNAKYRIAKAALEKAKLDLANTQVFAPTDGKLANFNLRVGSMVTAHTPLFALIEKNSWWIMANFKETQLSRIKSGQSVIIKMDMYPRKRFMGSVEAIGASSSASFSLLPPENATGNWVKITQRFPVKIRFSRLPGVFPLRLGASSTVTIDTK